MMNLIGLTGGIATGKSAVAEMFRQLGMTIIDLDVLARKVVEPGLPAYNDVVKRFGRDILCPEGAIDREKLGGIVFNDKSARRDLEAITHPRVIELMMKMVREAEEKGAGPIMVDIPLLMEIGPVSWIETVVLVYADPETQLRRLMERDQCDKERAQARINSQMPIVEKKEKADIVIDNSGALEDTRKQVLEAWEKIKRK